MGSWMHCRHDLDIGHKSGHRSRGRRHGLEEGLEQQAQQAGARRSDGRGKLKPALQRRPGDAGPTCDSCLRCQPNYLHYEQTASASLATTGSIAAAAIF